MNDMMISYMNDAIKTEIQRKLSEFALIVSKRHDIPLKLLLQDVQSFQDGDFETIDLENPQPIKGKCLGVTKNKQQCKMAGKHGGFCKKHVDQKQQKQPQKDRDEEKETEVLHIGHNLKDKMFLKGCPACEKMKNNSKQNLLIEF